MEKETKIIFCKMSDFKKGISNVTEKKHEGFQCFFPAETREQWEILGYESKESFLKGSVVLLINPF